MKVLVIPSWYPPDGGWFFRDQVHAVSAEGVESAVAYVRPLWTRQIVRHPASTKYILRGTETTDDHGVSSLRRTWLGAPGRLRLEPRQTATAAHRLFADVIARWGEPDLIHAHSAMWAGYAARELRKTHGIPYLITEHRGRFAVADEVGTTLLRTWQDKYIRDAFQHAECAIAVSTTLARGLQRYCSGGPDVHVCGNGVDTSFFTPEGRGPERQFTFAYVGNLERQKGVHHLLTAMAALLASGEDPRLLVLGDGSEFVSLRRHTDELGLGGSVEFLGHGGRTEVRSVLARSHALVLPSEFESFGVALMEAMSMGLPVVTTLGTPPEVVPAFAGLRIPFGPAALTDGMQAVMAAYSKYDAHRIRQFVIDRHDQRTVARKVISIYAQALARFRSHGAAKRRSLSHG